jgi:hypothetical protein
MTRTFLVAVNIADTEDPALTAEDIKESLLSDGFSVSSVSPWSSPGATQAEGTALPVSLL